MRGIEYAMAGLFLILASQTMLHQRWIAGIGLSCGSVLLMLKLKPHFKIPLMIVLMLISKVSLKR